MRATGDVRVAADCVPSRSSRPVRAMPSSRSPGSSGTVSSMPADEGARVGVDVAPERPLPPAAAPRARDRHRGVDDRAAEVVDDVHVERRASSPGATHRRQRIGDDDHRPAGFDHRLPRQLRRPLVVEHDAEIIGAGSASHEKQNPPVGRYFSRRSVSMWWRSTIAW